MRDAVGGSTTSHARAAVGPRGHLWLGLAALLVVIGSFGSFLGARAVASNNRQNSHDDFLDSSRVIASILKLAIQHEQDLALSAGAFIVGNPDASQAQFHQWTTSIHLFERYPELQGIGEIVLVPAAQLSAFAARSEADPAGQLTNGAFQVIPLPSRPPAARPCPPASTTATPTSGRGSCTPGTPASAPTCRLDWERRPSSASALPSTRAAACRRRPERVRPRSWVGSASRSARRSCWTRP